VHTPSEIQNLYNALFKLEAQYKKDDVYPIHKKLDFNGKFGDIYEFLINQINIKNAAILDAGCGVGYGSLLFAQNGAKSVKGISISELEIERANANKTKTSLKTLVFEKATFDDTEKQQYDLIFCVESLKHSLDLKTSLKALLDGLKHNGKLYIVDDFFEGKKTATARGLMKDWHLNFLLTISDLKTNPKQYETTIADLTHFMPYKSIAKIKLHLLLFSCFKPNNMYKKLFKGGLLLDLLYLKKQMTYQLVVITKK